MYKPIITLLLIGNTFLVVAYVHFFTNLNTNVFEQSPAEMNSFLRQSRKLLALTEPLVLVLGNESCDLDSAVSAISLAYYYARTDRRGDAFSLSADERNRVLPIMNIARKYLPLKTEVTYFLKQHNIDLENIVCRDEISKSQFDASTFILVDHHVSTLTPSVVQVIDHRPMDPAAGLSRSCSVNIQQVASCTTLIADLVLQENQPSGAQKELLEFLYPVIVLDTVNFSPVAAKARPLDISVSQRIATDFNITEEDNLRMFDDLVTARADVSTLDSMQILSKDMKRVVSKHSGHTVVTMPGFPISVLEYVQMPDAAVNLMAFAQHHNCSVVLLMGMRVIDQTPRRDLAVIKFNDHHAEVYSQIMHDLKASADLQLIEISDVNFLGGLFFKQNNAKGSRKQVLPMVQHIVDTLELKHQTNP